MEQLVYFVLGLVVAVSGYLLRRWWEGQSFRDNIDETLQLVSLHKELQSGTFTLDALKQLKGDLQARAISQLKGQDEVLTGIGRSIGKEAEAEYEPQTQAEMNRYANHLAELAERELSFVADELVSYLRPSEVKAFRKVQKAWEAYASAQADFESLEAEGGTMQAMLWSATRRTLLIERAGYIKSEVNKRNEVIA